LWHGHLHQHFHKHFRIGNSENLLFHHVMSLKGIVLKCKTVLFLEYFLTEVKNKISNNVHVVGRRKMEVLLLESLWSEMNLAKTNRCQHIAARK